MGSGPIRGRDGLISLHYRYVPLWCTFAQNTVPSIDYFNLVTKTEHMAPRMAASGRLNSEALSAN